MTGGLEPAPGASVSRRWHTVAAALAAAMLLTYAAVLAYLSPLMLQDSPSHDARAVVMADLMFRHGREFGQIFHYHFLVTPYVLGDLILASLVFLCGTPLAVALWTALVFLAVPCALIAYLRAKRIAIDATLFMVVLSAYLGTGAFFVMGFVEFRLSVAVVLFALALVELLRRRWSWGLYAGFVAMVILAYLTHFAAVIFLTAALGTAGLLRLQQRTTHIQQEFYLLVPLACALLWHFFIASGYRQPQDEFTQLLQWGTAAQKLENLLWVFRRYTRPTDAVLGWTFLAVVLMWVRLTRRSFGAAARAALEPCVLAAVFLGLYLVFPRSYSEGGFIDVRALAFIPLFLVVGVLSAAERSFAAGRYRKYLAFGCAFLLAGVNLAYVAKHLYADGRQLALYRAVVAEIPLHSRVLPISTWPREGVAWPFLHVASFAVIDREALVPYLFSADVGSPMKYFRYVQMPYAPHEEWYRARLRADAHLAADPEVSPDVDWRRVAAQYQYLLVTKPFDAAWISVPTRVVKENEAAALLALN